MTTLTPMREDSELGPRVEIRGVCRFTAERAQRGFRLNRFLTSMREPKNRDAFAMDPESYMASQALTDTERDMVRRRDYAAMLDYGASNVALGKASLELAGTLQQRLDHEPTTFADNLYDSRHVAYLSAELEF